jgi:hypothetical protein
VCDTTNDDSSAPAGDQKTLQPNARTKKKRFEERSPEQVVFSNILQLKFKMEDYVSNVAR